MSNYTPEALALAFKALGNPHRVALLQRLTRCCAPGTTCGLAEAQRLCVGDAGLGLGIAPSTLSHHLKELHHAGLIGMSRRGKHIDCWINAQTLKALNAFLTQMTQGAIDEQDGHTS